MLPFQGANGGCYHLPNAMRWAKICLAFSQKVVHTLQIRTVA
jgi:hypothetical protein